MNNINYLVSMAPIRAGIYLVAVNSQFLNSMCWNQENGQALGSELLLIGPD